MKSRFFLIFLVLILISGCKKNYISTDQDIFFPKNVSSFIKTFESFELGMWNYVVVDSSADVETLCSDLKAIQDTYFEKLMCAPELSDHLPLLQSYLTDQFHFNMAPKALELNEKSTIEMSKLSFLMGEQGQKLLELTRIDPMNYKEQFFEKIKKLSSDDFKWKKGVLTHVSDGRSVIPVQFAYSPNNFKKTDKLYKLLKKYNAVLIGRHQGFYGNRGQIEKDLKLVTMSTIVLIILFLSFLYFYKLHSVILLFIPISFGVVTACLSIISIYGSIHGLTLSFGVGIVGLSLDYGIHALMGENSKRVWSSNLFGLLTTAIVFIVFYFSQVPLLKQMMLFSVIGLVVSFVATKIFVKKMKVRSDFKIGFGISKKFLLVAMIPLLCILSLPFIHLNFDFNRFDYIDSEAKPVRDWFYKSWSKDKLFFKLYKKTAIDNLFLDFDKTRDIPINRESIASYLPNSAIQKKNYASWQELFLLPKKQLVSSEKLYAPFFNNLDASMESPLKRASTPKYLKHLVNEDSYISLWFSSKDSFGEQLKKRVEGIVSLSDIFLNFSKNISHELLILTPITLFSIFIILLIRYRSLTHSLMCLFPFVFSLGLYLLVQRMFSFPISFMSIIGVFLIYGLSVDYGIFSTDYYKDADVYKFDLNSCLFISWLSSIIGFLPLVLCSHNVLRDLGLAIVIGLVGIWFSTFYVLPSFYTWRNNEN
ncbi:hypothetical protein A9Q84_01200 [Halobacteriovorax marinus]|uniref:Membrane transport protein MMPL domain-containing protein n=1 Tax=Halobacteriovorax marinus TaxID=97084 RepID=A0A1Y5FC52_9BACT|nr:hypothetical protein A9Q84_01200 [Halobacteriovorax marinus]